MKRLFFPMLIAMLFAGAIRAQEIVQRVITIQNGNRNGILHTIQDLNLATNVRVSTPDNDHIVLSGPKDAIAGFEEVIKQLDIPPTPQSNVEIEAYMIVASPHLEGHNPVPGPVFAELEPVIAQMKGLFTYKTFRLLDNFVLRSRSGERGQNSGSVESASPAPEGAKISYKFEFNKVRVDKSDSGHAVRFDGLHLRVLVPEGHDVKGELRWGGPEIWTDVDVPEGKKVVIGKSSGVEGPDSALFLVISAKVVD